MSFGAYGLANGGGAVVILGEGVTTGCSQQVGGDVSIRGAVAGGIHVVGYEGGQGRSLLFKRFGVDLGSCGVMRVTNFIFFSRLGGHPESIAYL